MSQEPREFKYRGKVWLIVKAQHEIPERKMKYGYYQKGDSYSEPLMKYDSAADCIRGIKAMVKNHVG